MFENFVNVTELKEKIAGKQDKTTIEMSQDEPVTVEHNKEKRMVDGVITGTTLTIQLPNNSQEYWIQADTEFIGSVIFMTGDATIGMGTVNIPSSVISGDDVLQIIYKGEDITSETVNNSTVYTFTPVEDKMYCFMYWWDGYYMVCEVTGYELP